MEAGPLLDALATTVWIWLVCAIGALLFAILVAYLRMCKYRVARVLATIYMSAARGVPPLAWLFIIYFSTQSGIVRFGPTQAAIITLIIIYGAYLAENYRAGIEATGRELFDGCRALGLREYKSMVLVVIPSALQLIIGSSGTMIISLCKDTTLVSLIGVFELTFYGQSSVTHGANGLVTFSIIGAIYLVLCALFAGLARGLTNIAGRAVA